MMEEKHREYLEYKREIMEIDEKSAAKSRYTTFVMTVRHTYRVWDGDMIYSRDLPGDIGITMYKMLDRDQRDELREFAECELTEVQRCNLEALNRGY